MNAEGNEKYIYSANNYVSSVAIDKLRLRVWPQGTVVFPKVGAALLTEKRRILTTDTIFDNNLMGLVPGERILSEYLYLILLQVRFSDVVQPGVVPSIKNSIVEDLVVSIPPLDRQSEIVAEICSFDDFINQLAHSLKTMEALRSAVVTDLLGGFHTIPDNYDNFMDEDE
jgi:type I restriction enzyme S subunit